MPDLTLSTAQITKARETGLTFRPVAGGKCRCNQLPELGPMSKTQRRSLSARIWPCHRTVTEAPKPALVQQLLPTRHRVKRNIVGDTYCKLCLNNLYGVRLGDMGCPHCRAPLRVVEYYE